MITFMWGMPGSGKSYEGVHYHLIPALRDGIEVWTNLPLNLENIKRDFPRARLKVLDEQTGFEDVRDYPSAADAVTRFKGDKILVIIDEVHRCIPVRKDVKDKHRLAALTKIEDWFAQHRHYGTDVLIMTQSPKGLNSAVLARVEFFITLRSLKSVFGRSSRRYMRRAANSMKATDDPTAEIVTRKLKPSFFKKGYYRSDVWGGNADDGYDRDRRPFWLRPKFLFFLSLPLIFVFLVKVASPAALLNFFTGGALLPQEQVETDKEVSPEARPALPDSQAKPDPVRVVFVAEIRTREGRAIFFNVNGEVFTGVDLARGGWIVNETAQEFSIQPKGAEKPILVKK